MLRIYANSGREIRIGVYGSAVPDAAFDHPRLIPVYDVGEAGRKDLVHYERIVAEFAARSVVDVGCGTGTLACRLANNGLEVSGVDPSPASLAVAQAKPGADLVRWVHGDATHIDVTADMALMTGNVAQVFLTDSEWSHTLSAVHSALRPGGHLVFECRDPGYRGWEEWTRDQSYAQLEIPGEGQVEIWVELTDVSLPLVSFRWTYKFARDGAILYSDSMLRFRERDEIAESLRACSYEVLDVRDAPDRPGKEFVFITQRQS